MPRIFRTWRKHWVRRGPKVESNVQSRHLPVIVRSQNEVTEVKRGRVSW